MTADNRIKYIMNIKLMKITGIYQLLNPDTPKSFGCNIFKLGGTLAVAYLALVFIMCNLSIYYTLNDFTETVKYFMLTIATLFALIKMSFILFNSNALWNFISFTSIDYLTYRGQQKYILINARKLSISISNIFTWSWIAIVSVWILFPITTKDNFMNVKTKNETYSQYRYNMLNLMFPVSAKFYNNNFIVFYILESLVLIVYGYSMAIFDSLVISVCIAITYQLKSIALSYSTLGYNNIDTDFKSTGGKNNPINESLNDFNNLIFIIQDHQKCMKTIHEIYNLLRPIIIFQLFAESTLITLQPFLTVLNINNGHSLTSPESIKLILSSLTNVVHLFSTCYMFSIIDDCKNNINFALYDCDWTEKNITFKKLLLLSMQINNSEKLKLKATAQIIVNLQLFANVIHNTYKITSVLANRYRKMN